MAENPIVNHPSFGPWVDAVVDHASKRLAGTPPPPHDEDMEARVTRLEVLAEQTEKRLDRIETVLTHIDGTLGKMPSKSELFGYTATVGGIAFAIVATFVAVLAYLQDEKIASGQASAPQQPAPIIIQVPPYQPQAPAQPAQPPAQQRGR